MKRRKIYGSGSSFIISVATASLILLNYLKDLVVIKIFLEQSAAAIIQVLLYDFQLEPKLENCGD